MPQFKVNLEEGMACTIVDEGEGCFDITIHPRKNVHLPEKYREKLEKNHFQETTSQLLNEIIPPPALITPVPMEWVPAKVNDCTYYGNEVLRFFITERKEGEEGGLAPCPNCETKLKVSKEIEEQFASYLPAPGKVAFSYPLVVLFCPGCGEQHLCTYEGEIPF